MEELKKRLRQKLYGQANMGFDPEILSIGMELAAGHIDRGVKSFTDFCRKMIADLGDAVRPYLKAFYEGARNMPGMEGHRKDMTPTEEVNTTDVDKITGGEENNSAKNGGERKKGVTSPSNRTKKGGENGLQGIHVTRSGGLQADSGGQQEGLRAGEGGGGEGTRKEGRGSDSGGERQGVRSSGTVRSGLPVKNSGNNHSERGEDHAPKGVDQRIEANIAAMELAKRLLEEGRKATPEEMRTLRRFSGWGGLGKAFNGGWNDTYLKRITDLLGEEGAKAAAMSASSSYYTPARVIDTLWDIAKALGFKGGRVLEGSRGNVGGKKKSEEEEPKPVGKGPFGDIYDQFKGKAKEAIDFLLSHKSGDLLGVFHRDEIGDIDLVWGDDKGGLRHIIEKHVGYGEDGVKKDFGDINELAEKMEEVFSKGKVVEGSKGRYRVLLDGFGVVISRDAKGEGKNWVITAIDYNRSKKEKGITTNPTITSHGAEGEQSNFVTPRNPERKSTEKGNTAQ
ncbi:MAG: hypothetical protein LUC86_08145, partial [Prevotellaceae bacterium]|nr:hypothetical protein [Prevotellaceae bacterium]